MTDKPTAGKVNAKLQLVIEGGDEPIPLTTLKLPIHISHGSDYATYKLGIDLGGVTETVQAIFDTAAREDS